MSPSPSFLRWRPEGWHEGRLWPPSQAVGRGWRVMCPRTCLQTQHLVGAGLCPGELALSCHVMGTLPILLRTRGRKYCQ